MTSTSLDWRDRPAAEIAPLLRAEERRWRQDLDWDLTRSWSVIEPARTSGALPGLVARNSSGAVEGWTCFLVHAQTLQVAAFASETAEATDALIDGILGSPQARAASTCLIFAPDRATNLGPALAARNFRTERYRYLSVRLPLLGESQPVGRAWQPGDEDAAAALFARAYRESSILRPFAVSGEPWAWREYVGQLIERPDCGDFLPEASVVVASNDGVRGMAMVSRLTPATAHLMQIAVDPDARGAGLGRALLSSAASAATRQGARQLTLLVAESNHAAVRLYQSMGFHEVTAFVAATVATGGAGGGAGTVPAALRGDGSSLR